MNQTYSLVYITPLVIQIIINLVTWKSYIRLDRTKPVASKNLVLRYTQFSFWHACQSRNLVWVGLKRIRHYIAITTHLIPLDLLKDGYSSCSALCETKAVAFIQSSRSTHNNLNNKEELTEWLVKGTGFALANLKQQK